jgi:hypothetical protein
MTPRYWAGILAGMLAIFVVGLVVARGVDKGKDFVRDNFPAPLGLLDADFRVDGKRVGDFQRMQFMRSRPAHVDSAVFTVKLRDASDTDRLAGCLMRVTNGHPFGSKTRFVCVPAEDSADLALVPFGHVTLLPAGKNVRLYVSGEAASDYQSNAYRGTGSGDSGDVDIQAADGRLQISVNGRVIVQAFGDSAGGGGFVLRGPNGRPILEIHGDSNGGSLKVTDANGKTRVNINGQNDSVKH